MAFVWHGEPFRLSSCC